MGQRDNGTLGQMVLRIVRYECDSGGEMSCLNYYIYY